MRDPREFASAAFTLRASSLPALVLCPMRSFLHFQGLLDDPGGAAAEVGTLVHEVVAGWHRNGLDRDAAVARVGDWRQRFPRLAPAPGGSTRPSPTSAATVATRVTRCVRSSSSGQ